MLSPQVQITSKREFPTLRRKRRALIRICASATDLIGGCTGQSMTRPFPRGHDEGWPHYVVCFDRPKSGMLIMTNSSNGEDIYSDLLEEVLRDAFTPLEWEGFAASASLKTKPPLTFALRRQPRKAVRSGNPSRSQGRASRHLRRGCVPGPPGGTPVHANF